MKGKPEYYIVMWGGTGAKLKSKQAAIKKAREVTAEGKKVNQCCAIYRGESDGFFQYMDSGPNIPF
jgi:hypothetical protein